MKITITDVYNLYNYFYTLPQNYDIFSGRLPMLERCVNGNDILILALDNNKIVGFCLLEQKNNVYSNEATSVDKNYRQQGIATQMLTVAHQHIHALGHSIVSSGYSKDGLKYLKKIDETLVYSYARQINKENR